MKLPKVNINQKPNKQPNCYDFIKNNVQNIDKLYFLWYNMRILMERNSTKMIRIINNNNNNNILNT